MSLLLACPLSQWVKKVFFENLFYIGEILKCHQQCFSCKSSDSLRLDTAQILVYRPDLGQLQQYLSQGYLQGILKSVNLQYNMLVGQADLANDLSTMCLMFQLLFLFRKSLHSSLQKHFQSIFLFLYKITKMKIKSFECPKSQRTKINFSSLCLSL